MAQVKGTAVGASVRFVSERFGASSLAGVLRALPDEDRRLLEGGVLASSWYPMPVFLRFMEEAEKQLGAQEPDLVRQMGRASADYGVKTVYKIFFKIGSPEFIIGRAARVFGSYYDTGTMTVVETAPGRAVLDLAGFAGAPQFCERIRGWMERTVELAGATGLRSEHTRCVHRGDDRCRFEGTWS
jgi:uncharacterized protein DUF2378